MFVVVAADLVQWNLIGSQYVLAVGGSLMVYSLEVCVGGLTSLLSDLLWRSSGRGIEFMFVGRSRQAIDLMLIAIMLFRTCLTGSW